MTAPFGVPVVGLFGPTLADRYGFGACMADLGLDHVLTAGNQIAAGWGMAETLGDRHPGRRPSPSEEHRR